MPISRRVRAASTRAGWLIIRNLSMTDELAAALLRDGAAERRLTSRTQLTGHRLVGGGGCTVTPVVWRWHTVGTPRGSPTQRRAGREEATMAISEYVQLYVESARPGVRVVRVAGRLDVAGAARIVRLVESQISLAAADKLAVRQVVLDLADVTDFAPGSLESLHCVHHGCRQANVELHLAGCADRLLLLPLRVRQALTEFHCFPTLNVAVEALAPEEASGKEQHWSPA